VRFPQDPALHRSSIVLASERPLNGLRLLRRGLLVPRLRR
jgi:hypothetical protein